MADATCWQCAAPLGKVIMPVSRREECARCHSDIHVCMMCVFYDEGDRVGCFEERAEHVVDKERANFCEYYKLSTRSRAGVTGSNKLHKARAAKAQLAALFGDQEPGAVQHNDEQNSRQELTSSGSTSKDEQAETPAQAAERKLRALLNQTSKT